MVQTKTSRLLDRKTFQGGKPFGWISTLKEKILMPIQHLKLVFWGRRKEGILGGVAPKV